MIMTYRECREKFGSAYWVSKAVEQGLLTKVEEGVYSDAGPVSELAVISFKYPKGVMAFESAYFYHDLTDVIPDYYYMATPSHSAPIADSRVKQYYSPPGIYPIGIETMEFSGDKIKVYDLERLLVDTARMKSKLPPDLYKEVILAFRTRADKLSTEKIGEYLERFPKRNMIERILYEEVF